MSGLPPVNGPAAKRCCVSSHASFTSSFFSHENFCGESVALGVFSCFSVLLPFSISKFGEPWGASSGEMPGGAGEGVRSSSALGRGGSCRPEASAGERWLLITLQFEQVTDLEFLQLLLASVLLS